MPTCTAGTDGRKEKGERGRMIILRDWTGRNRLLPASSAGGTLGGLREMVFDVCGIAPEEQMLSSSSIALSFALAASEGKLPDEILLTVQVSARCLGGKGGFGAMLRGQSSRPGMKQVTPNTGAMRDLSGRRLRHVEQEQKLKDWAADAEKRKAEKEEEKKAKRQKYQEETHSVASEYVAQAAVDVDEIKDAVLKGIEEEKKAKERKAVEDELKKKQDKLASKKLGSLFGDDDDDDESSGSDTDAARKAAVAKPPAVPAASAAAAPTPAASAPVAAPKAAAAAAPVAAANAAPVPAQQKPAADFEDVNLEKVISLEKLEAMGGDRLKFALSKRGMKCGGAPKDRAARLWSVRGLARDKWPESVLAPPAKQ